MIDRTHISAASGATAAMAVAGLAPLVLAGLSQWVSLGGMDAELGLRIGVIYAAVVLTFLGGARAGMAYSRRAWPDMPDELAAAAATVLAAFLALMLPMLACLCLLVAAFMLHGLWDLVGAERGYVPGWYAKLRNMVTPVAVLSLMSMLVRLAV